MAHTVIWDPITAQPYESCPMPASANVIDFASYRKRRQARLMAEQMWAMYAARAGLATFTTLDMSRSSETRQA